VSDARAAFRRGVNGAAGAALIVVALILAWYAAGVLLAVFGGVIVALALRGAAMWFSGWTGVAPRAGVLIIVVVLVATVGLLAWTLADDVADQFRELVERVPLALDRLQQVLARHAWGHLILAATRSAGGIDLQALLRGRVPGVLGASLGAAAYVALGLFVAVYVALDPDVYRRGLLAVVPAGGRHRASQILGAVGLALRRWLVGRLVAMLLIGGLTALGLGLIGVPLGITLGLLAGLLNFVPYIGPLISFVPAALIALLQGPAMVLWVLALYAFVQVLESYVVTPLVQQRAVHLPPALTITAQIVLGLILGAGGLLFATPLTATALVVLQLVYVEDVLHEDAHVQGARPPRASAA
jgi:predicted PurR-regulated permease PerM